MENNDESKQNLFLLFKDKIISYKLSIPTIIIGLALLLLFQYFFYIRSEGIKKEFYSNQANSEGLGITTLITSVKKELMEAEHQRQAGEQKAMFILEDFDIEIQFIIKSGSQQSGKSNFEFFVVDTSTNIELQKLHKLKIHMKAAPPKTNVFKPAEKRINSNRKTKTIDDELLN